MAPNEEQNDGKQKETKTEDAAKESSKESEEVEDTKELDLAKERDRLKFHYRGYTLDQLKRMNMDAFIQ